MLLFLLVLSAISFTMCVGFTPVIRSVALRCNLVDRPDDNRKVHKKPIPRIGGVAVGAAYFLSLLAAAALLAYQHRGMEDQFALVRSIAPGAIVIFLVGFADDLFDLKAQYKFGVQIVAATMTVATGVHIHDIGGVALHPALGMAGSVLWLVACTNAINLIDGLDGLAAGISLVATGAALVGSLITGNTPLALAIVPLAGALLGFLAFNFNPASIFMGDSGSLLLGFLLGCFSIVWSGASGTAWQRAAPLLALAVPLLDTTLAIARRFLRRQPIFKADRSHVHHRLLARGLSHRNTVLLLYAVAATAATLSLCLAWAHDGWEIAVLAVFVCAVLVGIKQLDYTEFDALRKIAFRGGLRREITAYLAMQNLEKGIESAKTVSECWEAIQGACEQFSFHVTSMRLAGNVFRGQHEATQSWAMHITISKSDWIELIHDSDQVRYPTAVVPFINTMRRVLSDKSNRWVTLEEKPAALSSALYTSPMSA